MLVPSLLSWATVVLVIEVLRKRGENGELLPFLRPLPKHHPGDSKFVGIALLIIHRIHLLV